MINKYCVNLYCSEDISLIENYDKAIADKTQIWDIHHRLEIQGKFRNSRKLLIKCGLYYKVPASQLIFLTRSNHIAMHNFGQHREYRECLALRGRIPWMKGKKHNSESLLKMHKAKVGDKNPFFGKHHSEETRIKISNSKRGNTNVRGYYWWNNGISCKRAKECPGNGWVKGRIV